MQAIIENPASAKQSVKLMLANRTYRGALTLDERILDKHRDNGKREADFRQSQAVAAVQGVFNDAHIIEPGAVLIIGVDEDVAEIQRRKGALEALGLTVVIES